MPAYLHPRKLQSKGKPGSTVQPCLGLLSSLAPSGLIWLILAHKAPAPWCFELASSSKVASHHRVSPTLVSCPRSQEEVAGSLRDTCSVSREALPRVSPLTLTLQVSPCVAWETLPRQPGEPEFPHEPVTHS